MENKNKSKYILNFLTSCFVLVGLIFNFLNLKTESIQPISDSANIGATVTGGNNGVMIIINGGATTQISSTNTSDIIKSKEIVEVSITPDKNIVIELIEKTIDLVLPRTGGYLNKINVSFGLILLALLISISSLIRKKK